MSRDRFPHHQLVPGPAAALWIATAVSAALLPCCMEAPCDQIHPQLLGITVNAGACSADELDWIDIGCYDAMGLNGDPHGTDRTYVSVTSGWSEPFSAEWFSIPYYNQTIETYCSFVGSAGQEHTVQLTDLEFESGDTRTCSDDPIYYRLAVTLPWCDAPD